jgi:uncharacterized repeat protein (TIGR01451 family)
MARATASNTAAVDDDACTLVVQPGLEISKTGTRSQYANKRANYEITVRNTGDVALSNVVVTDTPGAPMTIVSAPGATREGKSARWTIGNLAGGATQKFTMVVTSDKAGTYCNRATASTASPALSKAAEACTEWTGYPAVLIEVIDTEDPLLEGESTTYVIKVTNQGTALDRNIQISAVFPREISPTTATGATRGTVSGQNVTFAPYAVLGPKEVIEFRIVGRAVNEGDSRLKVSLKTELLKTPVVEEESTHVY